MAISFGICTIAHWLQLQRDREREKSRTFAMIHLSLSQTQRAVLSIYATNRIQHSSDSQISHGPKSVLSVEGKHTANSQPLDTINYRRNSHLALAIKQGTTTGIVTTYATTYNPCKVASCSVLATQLLLYNDATFGTKSCRKDTT